jgi:hypothetical protein
VVGEVDFQARSRSWLDEYLFGKLLANALVSYGMDDATAWRSVGIVKLLTNHQGWFDKDGRGDQFDYKVVSDWLKDGEIQRFLQVNRYQGILWFNHESFSMLLHWMAATSIIDILGDPGSSQSKKTQMLSEMSALLTRLKSAELNSEYQVEKLLEAVRG